MKWKSELQKPLLRMWCLFILFLLLVPSKAIAGETDNIDTSNTVCGKAFAGVTALVGTEKTCPKEELKWEEGVIVNGNSGRLKRVMERARAGEELTIGFIGGSITEGSLASSPENCYAYLVYEWWKETFPEAEFTYVNAGIGGTTSQYGAARVQEDLLCEEPDFVIVEFSVNDSDTNFYQETYEGLIRNILKADNEPAVLLLHSVCFDTGASAQLKHAIIGKHYGIPCISMKETIYRLLQEGTLKNADITPDNLHPNDKGHELMAEIVTEFLERTARNKELTEEESMAWTMPEPFTKNAYENSVIYRNDAREVVCEGFEPDREECSKNVKNFYQKGWTAQHIDDRIIIYVEGTSIAVQYRKSVRRPAPIAIAIVDGDEDKAVVLDGNFDEDWGDCLYISTLASGLEHKKHKVEIIITQTQPDDVVPFYLVSVIGSF